MNKKGISHIEMILSFVIFMGFLIFVLSIFQPFKTEEKGDINLDTLEREILDKIVVNVESFSINLVSKKDCFYFPYSTDKVAVKDEDGEIVEGYSSGGNIFIRSSKQFFYIYSSNEFIEKSFSGSCNALKETDYSLGLFKTLKMASSIKLEQLQQDYTQDYENTKKVLEIPASQEFSFSVRDTLGTNLLGVEKQVPRTEKVLARDVPIQISYPDGNFKYAVLNIRTW